MVLGKKKKVPKPRPFRKGQIGEVQRKKAKKGEFHAQQGG